MKPSLLLFIVEKWVKTSAALKNKLSKKHHFVAQSVLERFKDPKGNLWHFKPNTNRGVEPRNTASIFQIRHDNTLKAGARSHDTLERNYGRLDDGWKKYTEQMIGMVTNGVMPRLNADSKKAFLENLLRQFWRSPDLIHDRDNSHIVNDVIEAHDEPTPQDSARDEETSAVIEYNIHNVIVLARNKPIGSNILDFYNSSFEISFLRKSSCVEPFIIGSAIQSASNGLIVVPLSKKVALALRPKTQTGPVILKITRKNADIIKNANVAMAKTSRWGIAGSDRKQIEILSKYCPIIVYSSSG